MTISADGVRFRKRTRNRWLLPLAIAFEAVLSFFLYISFAAHTLWPEDSKAAAGVASVLSYEGRLMDASGNPLGGTGTQYCFRFSIYDAPTGGTKLWPAGTPTNSLATSTDGVFSALIGQADSLTYNFYDSDTVYLNVDVNTTAVTCGGSWESLSPRQQIAATGYAQSAENVYSTTLFTDVTNNRVQVGSGTGGASPKFLGLDVKNTNDYIGLSCTTSGTMWYNSAISKALVCENGTIQAISNSSATTTLAAINANAGTPATTGTIVFSNSNGVTFGINGNTITASVAAGGGGGNTLSHWPASPMPLSTITNYVGASGATGGSTQFTGSFYVSPVFLEDAVSFSRINIMASLATGSAGTGSNSIGRMVGIYTLNGGTALSLLSSFMFRHEISQNSVTAQSHYFYWGTNSTSNSSSSGGNISSAYVGYRNMPIYTGNTSLSAGQYYFAIAQINRSSSVNVMPASNHAYISAVLTTAGQLGSTNLTPPFKFMGVFSSTTNTNVLTAQFMPGSVHTSVITNTGNISQWRIPHLQFLGT